MHKIFICLSLFLVIHIFAEENNHHDEGYSHSVELTEGLPSNIVNNTVSVISGEYIDSCIDIVLPGPRPLVYARTYSSFIVDGTFFRSWSDNQRSLINAYDAKYKEKKIHALTLQLPHGSSFTYQRSRSDKTKYELIVPKGLVNGSTRKSAGANIKNTRMKYDSKKKIVTSKCGDGSLKKYVEVKNDKKEIQKYILESDCNARNQLVVYKKEMIEGMLSSTIRVKGELTNLVYSQLSFEKDSNFKKHPYIQMKTSDGRKVTYVFQKHTHKVEKERKYDENGALLPLEEEKIKGYYLNQVKKSHAPNEIYEYSKNDADDLLHITSKEFPKKRYLKTEYYKRKDNPLGGHLGNITLHKYDFRVDRVKKQKAPVGIDDKPITILRMDYHAKIKKNKDKTEIVLEGSTDVYDAYWHKINYDYDENHRLKVIHKFNGTNQSDYSKYSFERFLWGPAKSPQEDNLVIKYLADWNSFLIHHGYYFGYDDYGNTTFKSLFGKLTGNPTPPLLIDQNNYPHENGYEREQTFYTYSTDGLNLLLSETNSDGKKVIYEYYPTTDLLKAKFIHFDDRIQLREFYHYDNDRNLVKKILDNSQGGIEQDWSYVNQRFITYYFPQNKIPYGLAGRIDEMFHDFSTGQEVLIKRVFNTFSVHGHLLNQQIFDATGQLAFSNSWEYDAHGNVIVEINSLGQSTRKEYDENDNLITQIGPDPNYCIRNEYDYSNRLVKQIIHHSDGSCHVTTHQYNYLNQEVSSTDPFGQVTLFTYNDQGHLISKTCPPLATASGLTSPVINMGYDLGGNLSHIQDPLGRVITCENNIRGKPLVVTHQDGSQEKFYYRLDGELIQKVLKNGSKVVYIKDPIGRIVHEYLHGSDGQIMRAIHRSYNGFSLLSEMSSDGTKVDYSYDFAGRLTAIFKNGILTQKLFYDPLGRVAKIHDWYDLDHYQVTLKTYDFLNRIIEEKTESQEGKLLHYQAFEYDYFGNKSMIKLGNQATYTTFNSNNKPTKIVDALGNTTYISYNMMAQNEYGQRVLEVTTTDPLGNLTIELYDTAEKVVRTTRKNSIGHILSNQRLIYDLCGNCIRVEDDFIYQNNVEKTGITLYHYGINNQLIGITEAEGTTEQKSIAYQYNHLGQKVAKIKSDGNQLIYIYDNIGRMREFFATDQSVHYSYHYNQKDQVTNVVDHLTNTSNSRSYNLLGQLVEETFNSGLKMGYSSDFFDRKTSVVLPDQTAIDYKYEGSNLREIHRIVDNRNSYSQYYEDYNLSGLIRQETRPGNFGKQTYQYDKLNRCISIQTACFKQVIPSDGFDQLGNLKKYCSDDKEFNFNYDDLNQIVSERGESSHDYSFDSLANRRTKDEVRNSINSLNQTIASGSDKFVYDRNGNLIEVYQNNDVTIYCYDALDRLTCVSKNGIKAIYQYDSFNRRISKQIGDEPTILYFYQDVEEIGSWVNGEIKELKVLNANNRKSVAIELNHQPFIPIQNLFGNVVKLVDLGGVLLESYQYSVFGELEIFDNADGHQEVSANPWLYSNRRLDIESGLYVFNLRYYDPSLGRWISPDPAGFEDGPNLYAHVHNNPLKYYDLLGLAACEHNSSLFSSISTFASNAVSSAWEGVKSINYWVTSIFCNPDPCDASGFYSINSLENPETGKNFNFRFSKQKIIVIGNGIYTPKAGFDGNLIHIANIADHHAFGIFDNTKGLVADGAQYYIRHYLSYDTQAVKYIQNVFTYLCENFPEADILYVPHSRCCVDTRNAFTRLPDSVRKRICILAVAPGGYIDSSLCKDVRHLVSKHDFVPWIDYEGRRACRDTIIELDPHPDAPLVDHALNSPTYITPIKDYIDNFINLGHL